MPVIDELPWRKIPVWIRIICNIFPGIIRWRLKKRRQRINDNILPNLTRQVRRCHNRSELEKLLGQPKYILKGEGNYEVTSPDNTGMIPDTVEIFLTRDCRIDLWFKDNHLHSITGSEYIWPWDCTEQQA